MSEEKLRFPPAPAITSGVKPGEYYLVPNVSYNVAVEESVSNTVINNVGTDVTERVFTVLILLYYIDVNNVNGVINSITNSIIGDLNNLNPGNEIDRTSDFDPEIKFLSQFDKRAEVKTIDVYANIIKVKKQFLPTAFNRLKTLISESIALNV